MGQSALQEALTPNKELRVECALERSCGCREGLQMGLPDEPENAEKELFDAGVRKLKVKPSRMGVEPVVPLGLDTWS